MELQESSVACALVEVSPPEPEKDEPLPMYVKAIQNSSMLDCDRDLSWPSNAYEATLADYVQQRFIPEFVMRKGTAGQIHFRAILKHVLPPELISAAFGIHTQESKVKLTTVPGWPYLDRFRLSDISADMIHELTSRALLQGYSLQTTTHIRNVVRSVFKHAIRTGAFHGQNPAAHVNLPVLVSDRARVLKPTQLPGLFAAMRYPEREMALFALLTGMSVAEICGLHWKNLNLSNATRILGTEAIPPKTIAVRQQSHRGAVSNVAESRRRFVRIPRALDECLSELRRRQQFAGAHDLVLVSRVGTPVHPENVAARRLKVIGTSQGIPWLTWSSFYRTRNQLGAQLGPDFRLGPEKDFQTE